MKQRGLATILVIILGFFIIFVLIGYFKNQKNNPFDIENVFKNQTTNQLDDGQLGDIGYPYANCGIEISSPFVYSKIDNVFQFSGKVDGCGWEVRNGFAGVFQMTDSKNNQLTDQISIPANQDGYFKINIALKRSPEGDPKMGLVMFKGFQESQVISYSVYIK